MSTLIDALPENYANYVKVSLDPFHDQEFRFEGAPTSRSATSVVLSLNQELTIAADDFPAVTDATWDCHVAMYPFVNRLQMFWAIEDNNVINVHNSPPIDIYPITAHGVNSGRPTFCTDNYANNIQTVGLDTTSVMTYVTGNPTIDGPGRRTLRIVGSSFEVVNETPDIYQQGAVTVYRYPLTDIRGTRPVSMHPPALSTPSTNDVVSPITGNPANCAVLNFKELTELRAPPSNQAAAVLVPGAQTWKAKDGCYVIATQHESEIPFKNVNSCGVELVGYTPTVGPKFLGTTAAYSMIDATANLPNGGWDTGTVLNASENAVFPFNLSGAYFTGLSKQYTVLRLRYKVFIEILTDPSDNTLAPLGTPTIPYNQELQETVMRVLSRVPPGFPQYMNAKGDVWRSALKGLGWALTTAAPISAAFDPAAPAVLVAGGQTLQAAAKLRKKKKDKPAPPMGKVAKPSK